MSGYGGVGVSATGDDLVINAGSIIGGTGARGQADAIDLSGGGNMLELYSTSQITGNVVSSSGTTNGGDTLELGGTNDGTFAASSIGSDAQYQGFANYNKTGTSTWTVTGVASAIGPWTIDAGTLAIGACGSIANSSGVNLGNSGATFDISNGDSQTIQDLSGVSGSTVNLGANTLTEGTSDSTEFDGVIEGTGNPLQGSGGMFVKQGVGTLILGGTNTYAGGTTISAGTLQIGNGGTTGSITGNVTDNAALVFDRSDTTAYGGIGSALSGNGGLTQNGTGTLILGFGSNFTGNITIASGTLQIPGNFAGDLVNNILDNAALVYSPGIAPSIFGGVISGTGSLTETGGNGTLVLEGANTYTGGTTISSGELIVGNAGTSVTGGNNDGVSGSIAGNITDNANLGFSRDDSVVFGGNISGTGALFKYASGILTLTGTNTYTGVDGNYLIVNGVVEKAGTYVLAGTLQIGNGGTSGSISGDVVDGLSGLGAGSNSTLAFDRGDSITFGGVVSGMGMLVQMGSGTLRLTGTNTYTGGTTVAAGTLLANGGNATGAGAVNVASGAALGGNGTIHPSDVTSGAAVTFASGATLNQNSVTNGLGTATLTLDLSNVGTTTTVDLQQGVKFAFDLGANGVSDQMAVTGGTLTLNNQSFADFTFTTLSGFSGGQTYDLFTTDASGDLLGSLGNLAGIIDGHNATLSVVNSQDLVLTVDAAVVPEPSTWALILGGLSLLAFWHFRRFRV